MKPKIIYKEIKKLVEDLETKLLILEAEYECLIYHFPYLDIIVKDGKQYVFPRKKDTLYKEKIK